MEVNPIHRIPQRCRPGNPDVFYIIIPSIAYVQSAAKLGPKIVVEIRTIWCRKRYKT
jgi:hypothetical protein